MNEATTARAAEGNGVSPDQLRRIRDALRDNPSQMTLQLARRLSVPASAGWCRAG